MGAAYRIERAGDTLREAGYEPQEGEDESLKDEGKIDERGGRHRGKLEGGQYEGLHDGSGGCADLHLGLREGGEQ